jgi:DedD protein
MDRRVKERLVGASILVVLIVLIVPELLSGPAPTPAPLRLPATAVPEPVRSVTVDLKTSKAQNVAPTPDTLADSTSATPPADQPSAASGAAPSAAPVAAESANTAPNAAAPASHSVENAPAHPISQPAAGKPASASHWSVQVGSFASHDNADKLTRQLKAQGFAAYVLPGGSGNSLRYRVRVGPLADHEAAAQTASKLKTLKQGAAVVSPGH